MSSAIKILKEWKFEQKNKVKNFSIKRDKMEKDTGKFALLGKIINTKKKRVIALSEAIVALEQKEDDRKQGALEELEELKVVVESVDYQIVKEHIDKRIKELEGVKK